MQISSPSHTITQYKRHSYSKILKKEAAQLQYSLLLFSVPIRILLVVLAYCCRHEVVVGLPFVFHT